MKLTRNLLIELRTEHIIVDSIYDSAHEKYRYVFSSNGKNKPKEIAISAPDYINAETATNEGRKALFTLRGTDLSTIWNS